MAKERRNVVAQIKKATRKRLSADEKIRIVFRDRVKKGALPCNLAFLATCDEEYGMAGAHQQNDSVIHSD